MSGASWIEAIDGPSPPHVLSKSTAHLLVSKSPLHAHLRKTKEHVEDATDEQDEGSIVHAMILGAGKRLVVLDVDSFRTKAAKAARDQARAEGAIPIKAKDEEIVSAMARRLKRNIEALGFVFDGESEIGVRWFERSADRDEIECWGALDHYRPQRAEILDLKIVRSAHPDACRKHLLTFGGDIQAAAYTRAVEQIEPRLQGRVRFVFLFCELYTGAVTPVELSADFQRLGSLRWQRAVNTWARCLRTDEWPGYAREPVRLSPPTWAIENEMTAQHDDNLQTFTSKPAGDDAGEGDSDHEYDNDEDVF